MHRHSPTQERAGWHGIRVRVAALFISALLVSCSNLLPPNISTPLPTEFLPTAAALTIAASGAILPPAVQISPAPVNPSAEASPTEILDLPGLTSIPSTLEFDPSKTESPSAARTLTAPQSSIEHLSTLFPTEPASPTPEPSSTALIDPPASTATMTPGPPIPEARIQILRLGELSKVVSPLQVSTRLTCGEGKIIRFELYGEDGRLLARYLRTYTNIPWNTARIGFNMDFEISAAAEIGRLVVSAEDSLGRLIEAASMDFVLMAQGMSEINPPSGLQQRIIIQDPQEQSLIQTGKLIVSGRARPASNQPLRAMLVGEDGKILGQRLAGIVVPIPGDYGVFVAEIPYSVADVTPALLVVFEEGGAISPYTFLTSIQVLLAP